MMNKNTSILISLLILLSTHAGISEDYRSYSLLSIEYTGPQDHIIYPLVISDSKEGAEWYRDALRKKGHQEIVDVHVVSSTLVKSLISDIQAHKRRPQQKSGSSKENFKTVSVSLVAPKGAKTLHLSTAAAIPMLDRIKDLCKGDQSLQSEITVLKEEILHSYVGTP